MTPQNASIAFAGLGGIGSLMTGIGQYQSGQAQKSAYDYNAAVTLEQMQEQEETSEAKYSTLVGKQASLYAKAGVDIASGSPLLVLAHTAATGAIEQTREKQAGTEEAAIQEYEGKVAAWSGTFGGISSFLGGLSKTGSQIATILS